MNTSWRPIKWQLDRVFIIRRSKTSPFEIVDEIQFGSKKIENVNVTPNNKNEEPAMVDELLNSLSLDDKKQENDNSTQQQELIKKITLWMRRLRDQGQGLPNSKQSLSRAITKMCYVSSVINVNSVFAHLLSKKFISNIQTHMIIINYKQLQSIGLHDYNSYEENKLGNHSGSQYSSFISNDYNSGASSSSLIPSRNEQEKMAIDRVVLWLHSFTPEMDKLPLPSFNSQLKQLCLFKVYVSADSVIDFLQSQKILQIGEDYESITYAI